MVSPLGPMISFKTFEILKIPSSPLGSFMKLSPLILSNTMKVYINRLNKIWFDMPEHTAIRDDSVNNRKYLTYYHWFKVAKGVISQQLTMHTSPS
jgi:hypothetical protein